MNIKELLLEGCTIKMPYKIDTEDWVGEVGIGIFAGGYGIKPKIIAGDKKFEMEELDAAIEYFEKLVFCPKNLMYKMNQAIINVDDVDIDLDIDEDLQRVLAERQKIINHREELTYEERVKWFFHNYYETGMEYGILLHALKNENLDCIKWYGDSIKIPKYKDELKDEL
jgi:hypothetical protein